MKRVARILVPFLLALVSGIFVSRLFNDIPGSNLVRQSPRFEVFYVPKIALPKDVEQTEGLAATVELLALFGSDGTVRDMTIMRLPPALVRGKIANPTALRLHMIAIDLVRQIRVRPAVENLEYPPHWVNVVVEFSVKDPQGWPNCTGITTTISNTSGHVLWKGNTSVYHDCH